MPTNQEQSITAHFANAAYDVVALAASAGGLTALSLVLSNLPADFPAAVVLVQHLDPRHRSLMAEILGRRTLLQVKQAKEADCLQPSTVYIAPPDRHLLVNPDGSLSLSQSELVHFVRPSADLLFESVAASYRERAITVVLTGTGSDGNMGVQAIDAALVAQVVVNHSGIVILANKQARSLFGLDPRDIGRPFKDLELSYRPLEMRSLIERARRERRALAVTDAERPLPAGEVQHLDVQVIPLQGNGEQLVGVSIIFQDVTQYHQLEEELLRSRQDRETAYEELETTNEELQSTVEELQTTNEELQSTNEEMETMNEELQSTNEELQAINAELNRCSMELDQANSFLHSILASVEVGVVVVDRDFKVILWNNRAEDLWGLRAEEVRGQSLFSLDIGLPVEKLKEPVHAFLAGQADQKEMVLDAVTRRGKRIQARITSTLRLGPDREPQGVVLLMKEEEG